MTYKRVLRLTAMEKHCGNGLTPMAAIEGIFSVVEFDGTYRVERNKDINCYNFSQYESDMKYASICNNFIVKVLGCDYNGYKMNDAELKLKTSLSLNLRESELSVKFFKSIISKLEKKQSVNEEHKLINLAICAGCSEIWFHGKEGIENVVVIKNNTVLLCKMIELLYEGIAENFRKTYCI